jgi:DNA polymerase-1
MKIIDTSRDSPEDLSPWERSQVYNGLDCCITREILDKLLPQLDEYTEATYTFERQLQGPVLEMRLRGILVNKKRKEQIILEYEDLSERLDYQLSRILSEGVGFYGFSWRSNKDIGALFYDRMNIPEVRKQGRRTVDRDALEAIETYPCAVVIVKHIKALRDIGKRLSVLQTEIDRDGRLRTSYNIAGTSTGRFSSSLSEFGTGTNMQNIEDAIRPIFIADPGMKMAYIDAQQGESRVVGAIEWNLFRDGRYLDACESGDLHTSVARLCWPDLPWTGELACDQALAEKRYYRHYTRRFMCKKIGHGTNYGGGPPTLARQAKIDLPAVIDFQANYFAAFPAHQRWHSYVAQEVKRKGVLISLMGRKRTFWGRRDDPKIIREALAYDPQGSLADIVNQGMLQVWAARDCQLLLQNHDAIVVQYPEKKEDEIIPKLLKQIRLTLNLADDRQFTMPYSCKTGWNFGEYIKGENEDGLKEYKGKDQRIRQTLVSLVGNPVHRLHREPRGGAAVA